MAIQKQRPPYKVECYLKWLRLRNSKEYREASQEIRQLQDGVRKSDERFSSAQSAYLPYLEQSVPDSIEKRISQKKYWKAEESARKAQAALSSKEEETCKRFGVIQWWDPDDDRITIEDADCVVSPVLSVIVVQPTSDKRVDWNTKIDKDMRRTLEREGKATEPPRTYTMADKDGWLTLKINLNAPLEESERAIKWHLRVNRGDPPNTRKRPDKDAEALEAWVLYEQKKNFQAVANHLNQPVNTVKGQVVRATFLIFGQRPTGSIKRRRVGIIRDPASEYQAHLSTCSRCNNPKTVEDMCPKFIAYVNQDTKASLDKRAIQVQATLANKGKRNKRPLLAYTPADED